MAYKKLGFMQLSIIVGYSIFYAWYLVTFFGFFISFPIGMTFFAQHFGQVVFFGGSLIFTELILVRSRKRGSIDLMQSKAFYLVSPLLGLVLPVCVFINSFGVELGPLIFYAACLISGFYVAIGFVYWDDVTRRGYIKRSVYSHGVVFAIGGTLFVLCETCFSQQAQGILSVLFLAGSAALLLFITSRAERAPKHSVNKAHDFFKTVLHLDFVTCVATIPFGFAFVLLYWQTGYWIVAIVGIAVVADFAFTSLVGRTCLVPFIGTLRLCIAFSATALIAYAFPFGAVKTASLSVIVIIWFVYRTVHGGALLEMAMSNRLSVQYTVSRGKLTSNIGFCVGLIAGIVALQIASDSEFVSCVALGIVVLIVVSALILLPFDNESNVPGIKTLRLVKYVDFPDESKQENTAFEDKCKLIVKLYKLSPRESDVLVYIIQGRNAKHVAEKLFISENTAKTHIANIYRKVGVHSAQELLDVFDSA